MNVDFFNIIDVNIFSSIILLTIIINTNIHSKSLPLSARYRQMLACSLLAIFLMDSLTRVVTGSSGPAAHTANYIGNFIYFILQPLPVSLGLMYLFSIFREKRFSLRYHFLFLIPFFAGLLVMIYSSFTEFIFYIDDTNQYHRGPGMFIYAIINYSFAVPAFILSFHYRDIIKRRTLLIIIAYTIIPYIGSFLQLLYYGVVTAWPSFTLGVLITYVFLEVHNNERDYLTGLLNRHHFDIKINRRIRQFFKKGAFTLVVIDLNDFKSINDEFGHDKGDEILQAAGMLLSRSVSMTDTVARYGGDEFVLIMETSDETVVRTILERIDRNITIWNEKRKNREALSLSAGYVIYDPQIHSDYLALFRQADARMFENKELIKKEGATAPILLEVD